MEFKHTEEGEKIIFTTEDERQVVGAAYLEQLARAAKQGDIVPAETRKLHCKFADVGKTPKATKLEYPVDDAVVADLGQVVQHFVDNTPEAVQEIAQHFGPTYLNTHIVDRTKLGLDAEAFMRDFEASSIARQEGFVVPDTLEGFQA